MAPTRTNPAIAALKEGAVILVGHPHNDAGPADGHVNIYPSLEDVTTYYRVKDADILFEQAPPTNEPFGSTTFFVKKDAHVLLIRSSTASEQVGLLDGPLSRRLAEAGSGGTGVSALKPTGLICLVKQAWTSPIVCWVLSQKSLGVAC